MEEQVKKALREGGLPAEPDFFYDFLYEVQVVEIHPNKVVLRGTLWDNSEPEIDTFIVEGNYPIIHEYPDSEGEGPLDPDFWDALFFKYNWYFWGEPEIVTR